MKNPPHTAHISHSRLKECRLVLSGTRALPCVLWARRVVCGKYTLYLNRFKHINTYTYHIINTLMDHSAHLNGHKSISIFSSLIPIHLLTTRLATLKHSATVAREARVQAQEVGVINITRFSQGDTAWGYLVVGCPQNMLTLVIL